MTCRRRLERSAFDRPLAKRCRECRAERERCSICGGRTRPDRRTCSDACHSVALALAGSKGARILGARLVPATHRECAACGKRKRIDRRNFYVARRDDRGRVVRFDATCKPCKRAYQRDRYRTVPEIRAQALAKAEAQREEDQRRREADPQYREARRRQWRAYNRAWKARRAQPDRGKGPSGPPLPAPPLAARIDLMVREQEVGFGTNGTSAEIVCESLGIDARQLYAWRTGEVRAVSFDVADRVLLNANLEATDVWDEADLPEWLTASA